MLTIGLHISMLELKKLTMFQLYDLVERFMLWINWDIDLRSRLAGAKPDEHPENWRFEYYIVGIDTTGSNEIRVFKVELSAVESRREVIRSALKEIIWHQANNLWEHSREYYEGDGSESLNL